MIRDNLYPKPIQKLIELFIKFPGIGPKQAARFAFYLLKEDKKTVSDIAAVIAELKEGVGYCSQCYRSVEFGKKDSGSTDDTHILCDYCRDKNRDSHIVMVVEKEQDIGPVERTKKFNGLYHVLGGTISPLDSAGPAKLHIKELFERTKKLLNAKKPAEIILATNPTTEGDTTALYIERVLKPLSVSISRLGRGLSLGSELEYADQTTVSAALTNRK